MKFRIHFTIGDIEDSVVISGDDELDILDKSNQFFARRGYTPAAVQAWSEEIK